MTTKVAESEVARHIARTAARLFAERGYDATSVREIVEAAGVTKPTLYYHFGSKEGLAQAVLTRPMTEFVARLTAHLDEADPVEGLVAHFRTHFEFLREDPDRGRFYYALAFGPHKSSLFEELVGFGLQLHGLLVGQVDRLVEAGKVEAGRAGRFILACQGAVNVLMKDALYHHACKAAGIEPGALAGLAGDGPGDVEALVDDLLHGFGPRATPPGSGSGSGPNA